MARAARVLLALGEDDGARAAAALDGAGLVVRRRNPHASLADDLATFRADLVLIDLPGGDPHALAPVVRMFHPTSHPLVLCLVDTPAQWLAALEAGADAHLLTRYTARELLVSVRTLLRRPPWLQGTVHQVAGMVIDEDAHVVLVDDAPVVLGKKEFGVLATLARHRGAVVSKRALLDEVWGYDAYDENLVEGTGVRAPTTPVARRGRVDQDGPRCWLRPADHRAGRGATDRLRDLQGPWFRGAQIAPIAHHGDYS